MHFECVWEPNRYIMKYSTKKMLKTYNFEQTWGSGVSGDLNNTLWGIPQKKFWKLSFGADMGH